jgi:hypothetical protein
MVTPQAREDREQILRELAEITKDLEDVYYFTRKLFDDIFETIKPEADPRFNTHRIEAAYIRLELIDLAGRIRRVLKNMQPEGAENVSRK